MQNAVAFATLNEQEDSKRKESERVLVVLADFVTQKFEHRRKDCVSTLALTAAMIVPRYCYATGDRAYLPAGGEAAMDHVITKYFGTDSSDMNDIRLAALTISDATKEYFSFRNHLPTSAFGSSQRRMEALRYIYEHGNVVDPEGVPNFWQGCRSISPTFQELAIKLATAFSGQGSAERCNKEVTLVRTKVRNRQTREVTCAYVTLKSYFRLHRNAMK